MNPIEHILEHMDSRAEKFLSKSDKTKNKKKRKQLKGDADALISEYYEWFDSYYNDLPFPQISGIRVFQ